MSFVKILPFTMIVLSVLASVAYLFAKDYRHAIYWASAATLNASITF